MKAELTQENRLRFESLYVGQDVFRSSKEPDESGILTPRLLARPNSKYDWLSLKTLSQISDEDAIEVGNILSLSYDDKVISIEVRDWISDQFGIGKINHKWDCMRVQDFLRSRGYALPWMGLSIDELVAAGWIRLV